MPPRTLIRVISNPATASPRTNFEAPSIAPKKVLSELRSSLRFLASSSLIKPDDKSASIAICFPGMASRLKRAETSAIRPDPFVITIKLTIINIEKTITPITGFPLIINCPKAWITCPAASVPVWPSAKIRRVEAKLSDSLSIVAIRSIMGNALKSSGLLMNKTVIIISTENAMEMPNERSSNHVGIGKISTASIATTAKASAISLRLVILLNKPTP